MSLRDLSNRIKKSFNDDEGWFQQGKFVPAKQLRDIKTDLPANIAYAQAKIAQNISPKEVLPTAEQMTTPGLYDSSSLGEQMTRFANPVNKSMSAQLNPFPVAQQTPQNIALEKQKQQILNSGAFRPAMARYLSTVPVNADYGGIPYGSKEEPKPGWGAAQITPLKGFFNPPPQPLSKWEEDDYYNRGRFPVISIGTAREGTTDFDTVPPSRDSRLNPVLAHELIHTSPRSPGDKKKFIEFYKNISPEKEPVLWEAGLTYLMNGNKPPNAEELYATLAQNIGPDVLNIPEVRRFFDHIFSEPQTKNIPIVEHPIWSSGGSSPGFTFNQSTKQKVR